MIVYSFNKKHFARLLAALVLAGSLLSICTYIGCERKEAIAPFATYDEIGSYFTEVSDSASHAEFLSQFGLEIKGEPRLDEVIIPESFNRTYEEYNALQKEIGLDLSRFRGQRADRLVYKLREKGYVTLLVFKGHVIGAHTCSGEFGDAYKSLRKNGKTR